MNGTLDVVGRDQCEQRLYLVRDREHLFWNLDHMEAEVCEAPPDPLLEKLNSLLINTWVGSPTDLADFLEVEQRPNVISRYLNINKSRLENEYGIEYQNNRTHGGRITALSRIPPTP